MARPLPLNPATQAPYDAAIIGAGFGGLATALSLAERGARVILFETVGYPGGCASTFERRGLRYESGATLFSGFAPGQLFHRWVQAHELDVDVRFPDPLVSMRAPGLNLGIPPDRQRLIDTFAALPGAPAQAIHRLFALQRRVGDALWPLFDDPNLLPPFGLRELLSHAGRLGAYIPLARLVGRPLMHAVDRLGLSSFQPLCTYLNAICQISVQASAAEAEAPFALAALDYFFRGTGHVEGGIGVLADALVGAIERLGGEVRFLSRVKGLKREGGMWHLHTRQGDVQARAVAANCLPQDLARLWADDPAHPPTLKGLAEKVSGGWGAAMIYLVIEAAAHGGGHVEIIQDERAPFVEGNHLFCSVGDVQPHPDDGRPVRGVTVSTHVPIAALRMGDERAQADEIHAIHRRMEAGLARFAPRIWESQSHRMTASPRTFQRFTGRSEGLVGGIPRRAGLHNYAQLTPFEAAPGLFLVGDSVFPGQSTLATAVGGCKAAAAIARS